jgi:hypothetical protein
LRAWRSARRRLRSPSLPSPSEFRGGDLERERLRLREREDRRARLLPEGSSWRWWERCGLERSRERERERERRRLLR